MGTAEVTVLAVIDLWCGGACRGMLVGGLQADTVGLHGIQPGGGGGDHSASMAGAGRWGPTGNASGGGPSRAEGGWSQGEEPEERCPGSDAG